MPYKPKVPCKQPGCPNLIPAGRLYCEEHKKLHPEAIRSASARGYDRKWQKFSKKYLEQHPLCEECLRHGAATPATVVDHITPFRGDKKLQYDPNNLQALCKSCHDKKTGTKDRNPTYHY